MRVSVALLAAGLAAAPLLPGGALHAGTRHSSHKGQTAPAAVAPACEFSSDRTAFDIEGLKSELMVTALKCDQRDQFNAFMTRFRPTIAAEERDLNAYFKRSYGRAAQKAYDSYITNLGNIQEQDGLKAGTAFCENLPTMFSEVMSLRDDSELHAYANSKTIAQPVTFETCPAPAPVERTVHTKRRAKHA
jgi:hypothetical protein